MKGYTIQYTHIKCDFLTRPTQNSKQIASVPPTNNNNCVQLNPTSSQFGRKVRNAHLFTTTYKHLTKYHTWLIYKPDWYTVLLYLAIMWTFNDCHLQLVMFLRCAVYANISSSQYQIKKLKIGKWLQYGIIIMRFKLQWTPFPLPPHLIMNRLMLRHWYQTYHCDNEHEIPNQMAFRKYNEICTWLYV